MIGTSATFFLSIALLSTIGPEGAEAQVICGDEKKLKKLRANSCSSFDPNRFSIDDTKDKQLRYYSSALEGGFSSGNDLKNRLNLIIRDHKRHSYDCAWAALAEADEDLEDSHNVTAFYSNRSMMKEFMDCGGGGKQFDNWNREHIWSKSHGFRKEKQHAHTDLHHLVPADKSVNIKRNDRDFKMVPGDGNYYVCVESGKTCKPTIPQTNCTCKIVECEGCESGKGNTFEPPDRVKGQVARIMLYMDTRYDGKDYKRTQTPDLVLVNEKTKGNDENKPREDGKFGYLEDLLTWHCNYPVTQREIDRNNIIQKWQGNRNPFVDFPEFVEKIWGEIEEYKDIFKNCKDTKPPPPTQAAQVWINEFHYDNVGADEGEFIEVGCNDEVDITGFKIFLYNDGKVYPSGSEGYELQGACNPQNFIVKDFPSNGIQNGRRDGIALVDLNGKVVDFISYEGQFTAEDGPASQDGAVRVIDADGKLQSNDIKVSQNGSTTRTQSLQLTGVGCKKEDFEWKLQDGRSKGTVNIGQEITCNVIG